MNPAEATYRAVVHGEVVYEGKPEMRYALKKGGKKEERVAAFHHDVPWVAALEAFEAHRGTA